MDSIPQEIIYACNIWQEAEMAIPDDSYHKSYKSLKYKANRLYKIFARLCDEHSIEAFKTASQILKQQTGNKLPG